MKQVHGGNIEKAKLEYNLKQEEIIDFSANINFLGPPPGLINHLQNNLKDIVHYPEPASKQFKKKLTRHLHSIHSESSSITTQNLIISNGAVELIYQIVNNSRFHKILIPVPAFSEYEFAAESAGKQVVYIHSEREDKFKPDLGKIAEAFDFVDLLFICNPGNPTGGLIHINDIEFLLNRALACGVFVVIDEAFMDFIIDNEDYTAVNIMDKYNNLFILRSMTKFYAIPGLRLGYGLGSSEFVRKLEQNRDPWSVNLPAQRAGEYVIDQKDYIKRTRRIIDDEKKFFFNQLKKIKGLIPFFPAANYIFVDITNTFYTARRLTDKLAQKGILIRNCSSYTGLNEDYIRLAVKNREENCRLLDTLNLIL